MNTLPAPTRLAYALPGFGLALAGVPILIYLPRFYSDVVGVSVAWIGAIFLFGRVLDAVTDPLAGALSDRTRSRWGRRRPWVLGGALPLALITIALYAPPVLSPTAAMLWAATAISLWFVAFTAVNVPWRALGPELTEDYDERTGLFSLREAVAVMGTVTAASSPGVIGAMMGLEASGADDRIRYGVYAAIAAAVLLVTCGISGLAVKERFEARAPEAALTAGGLAAQAREALSNRPFAILLAAFTVAMAGASLPAVLINYFTTYVLGSEQLPLFMTIYFAAGLTSLPGWVALSRRIGKKRAWLAAMAVNIAFFAPVALLGAGQELAFGILVGGSGVGAVAAIALPYAMQADVIDIDELETGERREGLYTGIWAIAEKAAAAVGSGLALMALDAAGYAPNVEQTDAVIWALRVLYVGVPCVCVAIAFGIALRFPMGRAEHEALTASLAERRAGG